MAINKVVNKSTKTHGAMRNVIEYVLQDKKVKEGYVSIIGPYDPEEITWDEVYNAFLDEKKLWNKDRGRMYTHNIISFHKEEKITPEDALEFGRAFVFEFFSGHQNLICVHQDKNHLHIHIVTNTVSFLDGHKLHQTKHELEDQKRFTNESCLARGFTVAEKGKCFDGAATKEGEIHAWSKDKYQLLINDKKKSYLVDCAVAVMEVRKICKTKEEFIQGMEKKGWHTTWKDTRKNITFENEEGKKVRDSNLSKSFHMDISKELLLHEFERQTGRQEEYNEREPGGEQRDNFELEQYYQEVQGAIRGTDEINPSIVKRTKGNTSEWQTRGSDTYTETYVAAQQAEGKESEQSDEFNEYGDEFELN